MLLCLGEEFVDFLRSSSQFDEKESQQEQHLTINNFEEVLFHEDHKYSEDIEVEME